METETTGKQILGGVVKLHNLEVQNWFSYRHLRLKLDNRGAVLVTAPNGSGKSCIFSDSIPWCLFGQTIREKIFDKTSQEFKMDDVVNDRAKKDCFVALDFTGVDGHRYHCRRYRKDSKYGNDCIVSKVDMKGRAYEMLTGETVKETNEIICKLTGMTYDTYCNSVLFAQGAVRRFTQCTDAQKREIFEQFFDLEVFNVARDLVLIDKKTLDHQIGNLENDLARETSLKDHCDEEIEHLQKEISGEEGVVSVTRGTNRNKVLKHKIDTLKKSIAKAGRKVSEFNKRRVAIHKKLLDKEARKKLLSDVEHAENRVRELQSANKKDEADLESYRNWKTMKVGDECPECLRPMKAQDVANYKDILEQKVILCRHAISKRASVLKSAIEIYEELQSKLDKNGDLLEEDQDLSDHLSELLGGVIGSKNELAKLEREQSSIESEVEKSEARLKILRKQLKTKEKELEGINANRSDISGKIAQLQLQLFRLEFWLDGFSNYGIKDFCYSRLVGILNAKLIQYSQRLTNGEIEVLFSKDAKDKLRVNMKCRRGAKKHIMSSNGQQRRADLCIAFAFQSIVEAGAQPVNISIIDEFDAGLDAEGLNRVEQYITEEAKRKSSIFLMTHNPQLAGLFSNIIRVKQKEDGESYLVEEK